MVTTMARHARAQLDRSTLADGEPMRFVASTDEVNRYGFALRNDGWQLDNYNANPVVLWMHNPYTPPLGRGRAVSDGRRVILDEVVFDAEDEMARAVERKLRLGFLNTVSVSWDYVDEAGAPVLDYWRLKPEEIATLSYDLAEVSVVTVPGDPRAVREQQARLAAFGAPFVSLLDDRERGDVTADEVRSSLLALAARAGIDLSTPSPPPVTVPPLDADPGVEAMAARTLLAAFSLSKEETA